MERVWGGNKSRSEFGYDLPSDNIGECWVITANEIGDCVCTTEEYKGKTLTWLWENKRELFGNYECDRFPLLLKILDAKTDLSIQVHPDDAYMAKKDPKAWGKTESWYILNCDEGATVVVGHNARTREELREMIDSSRYKELIREVEVHKGDFIQIDAGTIHSIKGGVMILETQQNSDITYRVYDYDRLWNGKLRTLHREEAKDVTVVPAVKEPAFKTSDTDPIVNLVSCKYYDLFKLNVKGDLAIDNKAPFRLVSCIEGSGTVNKKVTLKKGDHFIVPAGIDKLEFNGEMTLITSVPGKR